MEMQLRFIGNSEKLVLQSRLASSDDWTDCFTIEDSKAGYRIATRTEEVLVFRTAKDLSPTQRLLAQSANQEIAFYKQKTVNKLWEPAYWQGRLDYHQDEYKLKRVGSGTKGDLLPVTKNGQPVAVFSAGKLSIASERSVLLYTESLDDIAPLLLLYVINYLNGMDILDRDLLTINYRMFYQFDGRSALTKAHLAMLPEPLRPSRLEGLAWVLISLMLIGGVGFLSPKHLLLFLGSLLAFHAYVVLKNMWDQAKEG